MHHYVQLEETPVEGILARPRPENLFEWRFVLFPPDDSPYAGGQYQGTCTLQDTYSARLA